MQLALRNLRLLAPRQEDATLESVVSVLPDLRRLHTQVALLSGGEPLLNPQWQAIVGVLRDAGVRAWLLTSGLALAKYAAAVAGGCDSVTVSLDGTTARTYQAIRGLDAFDKVCEGVCGVVARGTPVNLRVTLQRSNYRELTEFVALARELGVRQVSFLAVDVSNPHAFARGSVSDALALAAADLPRFARLLDALERDYATEFRDGFIAESPEKMRRIYQYFAALNGRGSFPRVRCNAPEFSAVIAADGRVAPCFIYRAQARTRTTVSPRRWPRTPWCNCAARSGTARARNARAACVRCGGSRARRRCLRRHRGCPEA